MRKKLFALFLLLAFALALSPNVSSAGEFEDGYEAGKKMRADLKEARALVTNGKLNEADKLLDGVLRFFKTKVMTEKDVVYLSMSTQKEVDDYKAKAKIKKKVLWITSGLAEALHLKAYIASEKSQWKNALEYLNQEIKYDPYAATAYNECGYVYNKIKQHKKAMEAYNKAFDLAKMYDHNSDIRATALRGKGFTYIETGDLKNAKKEYEQSQKYEPDSRIAKDELEYIKKLEGKKKN